MVKQMKRGWDLYHSYYCSFCKRSFEMSTGPKKDPGTVQKRGRQMRPINKIMFSSIFKSGCVRAQVQEMFSESGVVCPSGNGLDNMMEKIKGAYYVIIFYSICIPSLMLLQMLSSMSLKNN